MLLTSTVFVRIEAQEPMYLIPKWLVILSKTIATIPIGFLCGLHVTHDFWIAVTYGLGMGIMIATLALFDIV